MATKTNFISAEYLKAVTPLGNNIDNDKLPDSNEDRTRVNAAPSSEMPIKIRKKLELHFIEQRTFLENKFSRDLSHWF